jgi:hypothetical protein
MALVPSAMDWIPAGRLRLSYPFQTYRLVLGQQLTGRSSHRLDEGPTRGTIVYLTQGVGE